jgi:glycosyltransferase 2 family protein
MNNRKKITAMLLIAIGFYILYAVIGNISSIKEVLREIPNLQYLLFLLLVIAGYVCRFLRWHYLLRVKQIRMPLKKSIHLFITGMSMAISPGKLGEFLKTYYLHRDFQVDIAESSPVVLLERFTDILAIALLMSIGLFLIPHGPLLFAVVFIFLTLFVFLLKNKSFIHGIVRLLEGKKRKGKWQKIKDIQEQLITILTMKTICISTFLGIVAWFLECVVLYAIFHFLNLDIKVIESVVIFSAGTLLGAVSMIPGGIGLAEGSMTSLMVLFGAGTPTECICGNHPHPFINFVVWHHHWICCLIAL